LKSLKKNYALKVIKICQGVYNEACNYTYHKAIPMKPDIKYPQLNTLGKPYYGEITHH
jgi:hypothetical protein